LTANQKAVGSNPTLLTITQYFQLGLPNNSCGSMIGVKTTDGKTAVESVFIILTDNGRPIYIKKLMKLFHELFLLT
jgi:hypothetical protein